MREVDPSSRPNARDPGAPRSPADKAFRPPNRSSVIAMRLFVLSLAILFAASMAGYVAIRTGLFGNRAGLPPLGSLRGEFPWSLWVSTALVLAASVTISLAVAAVRRERQRAFRGWLAATLGIAAAFVLVQAPSLGSILVSHFDQLRTAAATATEGVARPPMALLGLIFFLIVVHALHVVGGIAALGWVLYRAGQNAYDHEHYLPIRHTALYWHFLDVVWLAMFGTMLLLG